MEQLFYAPDITTISELPEEESLHCIRVLRLKSGDPITITDGKGFFYHATIEKPHPKHCQVSIVKQEKQKPLWDYRITMAVAPTKNMDRMEWFVEKTTEIGVDTITFLRCFHSERKEIKLQRLRKTAISAMKQSFKATIPQIDEMIDFHKFISHAKHDNRMIATCIDHQRQMIKNIYTPQQHALILIGPEGDFSPDEILAARTAGFVPVSLGESRLRTETAALIACHTIHLLNR